MSPWPDGEPNSVLHITVLDCIFSGPALVSNCSHWKITREVWGFFVCFLGEFFAFVLFETKSYYVAQAGLELKILHPQPPTSWDHMCALPHPTNKESLNWELCKQDAHPNGLPPPLCMLLGWEARTSRFVLSPFLELMACVWAGGGSLQGSSLFKIFISIL
jgi:hypothetical protein